MPADASTWCGVPFDEAYRIKEMQFVQQLDHKDTAKICCELFIDFRYLSTLISKLDTKNY